MDTHKLQRNTGCVAGQRFEIVQDIQLVLDESVLLILKEYYY